MSLSMNHVQELIDEHKHELPVGLAKELLEACKQDAETKPILYKVSMTTVKAVAYDQNIDDELSACVKLVHDTQSIITELYTPSEDVVTPHSLNLFKQGFIHKRWLEFSLPHTIEDSDDGLIVLSSITPFEPQRKRARG